MTDINIDAASYDVRFTKRRQYDLFFFFYATAVSESIYTVLKDNCI